MRADVREAAPQVERAFLLERAPRARRARSSAAVERARVAHRERAPLSPISSHRALESLRHRRRPTRAARDQSTAPCSASAGSQTATLAVDRARRRARASRSAALRRASARAIALQRGEIAARREREHDVEKAPSRGGRAGDELDVGRREHHRRQRAERVAQALGDGAVEAHALPLARALEPDADLVAAIRRRPSAPM